MRNTNVDPKLPVRMPDAGMVLLDQFLEVIACDRGGEAILDCLKTMEGQQAPALHLAGQVLQALDHYQPAMQTHWRVHLRIGESSYVCRCYRLEFRNGGTAQVPFLALDLERMDEAGESLDRLIATFDLTDREEQTLRGILSGLSTKEIADQMGISPNTVKAFTRFIMIKLGVTTRWGIITKILGNREGPDNLAQRTSSAQPP